MDFKTFVERASELRNRLDPSATIALQIQVWSDHGAKLYGLQWNVWTGSEHVSDDTPEKVLQAYELKLQPAKSLETLAQVGAAPIVEPAPQPVPVQPAEEVPY